MLGQRNLSAQLAVGQAASSSDFCGFIRCWGADEKWHLQHDGRHKLDKHLLGLPSLLTTQCACRFVHSCSSTAVKAGELVLEITERAIVGVIVPLFAPKTSPTGLRLCWIAAFVQLLGGGPALTTWWQRALRWPADEAVEAEKMGAAPWSSSYRASWAAGAGHGSAELLDADGSMPRLGGTWAALRLRRKAPLVQALAALRR